jgi:hypothetical protein
MMQLMVRAARLQRPMARTSVGDCGLGIAGLYHRTVFQRAIQEMADLCGEHARRTGNNETALVIGITCARYRDHLIFIASAVG